MEYRVNNLLYAADNNLFNTFRTKITMTEPVNLNALRSAVDSAITRYPYFAVKLVKRGEKYVMVSNSESIVISAGGKAITLGSAASNYHLFAVAYTTNSIYIDTSHFITDGYGVFPFIKTLLYCYLHILHPEECFDTAGIALPDSEISPAELDDYPFPDDTLPVNPLGSMSRPAEVFMFDDMPKGYTGRENWTSFCVKIVQSDLMKFSSSVDGSPATFIASMMYRAISDLHPDNHLSIVCGMQHQYRKALGKPFSHLSHVNIVPIVYSDKMRGRDIEFLNTMARGTIIVRADDENDRLSVNTHVINEKKISNMPLAEKHDYMKKELLNGIGKNTFEVSYTGRVPLSGLDKYISNFMPIIDISLSGGISIEIFSVSNYFCINIMQRDDSDKYFSRFIELFAEYNIKCEILTPVHFEINDFVLPEK